jgi:hypothetical protein
MTCDDPRDETHDYPDEPCSLFDPIVEDDSDPDDEPAVADGTCPLCELYHPPDEPCDVDLGEGAW